jgi:four helix bundle protein
VFIAYEKSLAVLRQLAPIVPAIRVHDPDLAKQIVRAANSMPLNLREGQRRSGKDRIHFYRIAAGSASEVRAGLDAAEAWGWAVRGNVDQLDELLAILWKLTH